MKREREKKKRGGEVEVGSECSVSIREWDVEIKISLNKREFGERKREWNRVTISVLRKWEERGIGMGMEGMEGIYIAPSSKERANLMAI